MSHHQPTERMLNETRQYYADFLTSDSATLKTLHRVDKCCQLGSKIIWIEGASGSGKSHLTDIIMREHSRMNALCPYNIAHLTIRPSSTHGDGQLSELFKNHDAIICELAAGLDADTLEAWYQKLNMLLNHPYTTPKLLVFHSLTNSYYSNDTILFMHDMKQFLITNYYEYITIRSLNHRPDDILLYIQHFLKHMSNACFQSSMPIIDESLHAQLREADWIENIRDIQLFCLLLFQIGAKRIDTAQALQQLLTQVKSSKHMRHSAIPSQQWIPLISENKSFRSLQDLEQEIIQKACGYYKGCKSSAARDLQLGRTTLYRKLKEGAAMRATS